MFEGSRNGTILGCQPESSNSRTLESSIQMIRSTLFLILGFILFLSGFVSLVLLLVGLKLTALAWIDNFGSGIGLIIRLIMVFGGIIMIYLSRSSFQK